MTRTLVIIALLLFGIPALGGAEPGSASGSEDLAALIKKVEMQHRGRTMHGKTRMNITTRDWNRTLVMESWGEGREKFLVKILEPAKERGTCTLKVNDEIWNFLPKIDRLVKVPSSLMGDKWMGSHFTNDDLVKQDKIEELYALSLQAKEGTVWTIVATPKENAAVVWGKLVYKIDRARDVPVSVEYYDEDGARVRTMTFDRVEQVSGRWLPMVMKVVPIDSPRESTEVIYDSIEFDVKLDGGMFSVQSLRRR